MLRRLSVLALPAAGIAALALLAACSEYDLNSTRDLNQGADDDGERIDEPLGDGENQPGTGAVSGRICAPGQGSWVVGARVWVDTASGPVETTTDADGRFELSNVPEGTQVVHVEKGSFGTAFEVEVVAGKLTQLAEEECLQDDLEIAVILGEYDAIEHLIADLGFAYDSYGGSGAVSLLRNPSRLAEYDIVFFNCGMDEGWVYNASEIGTNLRDYVQGGGSIYASDWSYFLIESALPQMVTFAGSDRDYGSAYLGLAAEYNADVLDANLRTVLGGNRAHISYDLDMWAVPVDAPSGTPLLRATVEYIDPADWWGWDTVTGSSPLAVRMGYGSGTALYTSFHNERQATGDMLAILNDIILSL